MRKQERHYEFSAMKMLGWSQQTSRLWPPARKFRGIQLFKRVLARLQKVEQSTL